MTSCSCSPSGIPALSPAFPRKYLQTARQNLESSWLQQYRRDISTTCINALSGPRSPQPQSAMANLRGGRYLNCFYCGKRSSTKYDGLIREFLCLHCDATNYLDEVSHPTTHRDP